MFRSTLSISLAYAVSVLPSRVFVAWAMSIALLVFLSARPVAAQAAVEYGHLATGNSAGVTAPSNKVDSAVSKKVDSAGSDKTDSTASPDNRPSYVVFPDKHPAAGSVAETNPEDANRRALELRAGLDAAKLSFKSVPAKAVVRINGKPVGETPLLISLAPGTYKIEMEGPRMEFGKQQLTVGAKDTREVQLRLSAAPRYPNHITLQ
jgi:hypothetical protein